MESTDPAPSMYLQIESELAKWTYIARFKAKPDKDK